MDQQNHYFLSGKVYLNKILRILFKPLVIKMDKNTDKKFSNEFNKFIAET